MRLRINPRKIAFILIVAVIMVLACAEVDMMANGYWASQGVSDETKRSTQFLPTPISPISPISPVRPVATQTWDEFYEVCYWGWEKDCNWDWW